ncbi:MAG: two-component system response regulator [Candidatus Hydrogenedentota bacterium]
MIEQHHAPVHILMAEDNQDDVDLTREALQESKLAINLHHVKDGVEAMAFLRKEPPFENVPRPDLFLLDLNMPRKDGRQVLEEVRADDTLKDLPVVILTTSGAEEDILSSYKRHVNCYIQKPVDFEQFLKVVGAIQDFWFAIVRLPHRH